MLNGLVATLLDDGDADDNDDDDDDAAAAVGGGVSLAALAPRSETARGVSPEALGPAAANQKPPSSSVYRSPRKRQTDSLKVDGLVPWPGGVADEEEEEEEATAAVDVDDVFR